MSVPSYFPTQVGFVPTGSTFGEQNISTIVIGRTVSGFYEGAGFGQGGRPDYVQVVQINLVDASADALIQRGTITINVDNIVALIGVRPQFPTNLTLTLKEVLVCENNQSKGMVVLASQTYLTGSA